MPTAPAYAPRNYWMLIVSEGMVSFLGSTLFIIWPLYTIDSGFSQSLAMAIVGIMSYPALLLIIPLLKFGDSVDRKHLLMVSAIMLMLSVIPITLGVQSLVFIGLGIIAGCGGLLVYGVALLSAFADATDLKDHERSMSHFVMASKVGLIAGTLLSIPLYTHNLLVPLAVLNFIIICSCGNLYPTSPGRGSLRQRLEASFHGLWSSPRLRTLTVVSIITMIVLAPSEKGFILAMYYDHGSLAFLSFLLTISVAVATVASATLPYFLSRYGSRSCLIVGIIFIITGYGLIVLNHYVYFLGACICLQLSSVILQTIIRSQRHSLAPIGTKGALSAGVEVTNWTANLVGILIGSTLFAMYGLLGMLFLSALGVVLLFIIISKYKDIIQLSS